MFYVLFVYSSGATVLYTGNSLKELRELYTNGKSIDGVSFVQMGAPMGSILSAKLCGELAEANDYDQIASGVRNAIELED